MAKYCVYCGNPLKPTDKYCIICGKPVLSDRPERKPITPQTHKPIKIQEEKTPSEYIPDEEINEEPMDLVE